MNGDPFYYLFRSGYPFSCATLLTGSGLCFECQVPCKHHPCIIRLTHLGYLALYISVSTSLQWHGMSAVDLSDMTSFTCLAPSANHPTPLSIVNTTCEISRQQVVMKGAPIVVCPLAAWKSMGPAYDGCDLYRMIKEPVDHTRIPCVI